MKRNYWVLMAFFVGFGLGACSDDVTSSQAGRLETFPRSQMTFATVAFGESDTERLVLTNQGDGVLVVGAIEWQGSSEVSLEFEEGAAPTPIELAPDASYELQLRYTPTASAEESGGQVVIKSNDPDNSEHIVEVVTQKEGPEIAVTPSNNQGLNFGHVADGEQASLEVSVTNVGALPLHIEDIVINASSEFELELDPKVSFPFTIVDSETTLTFSVSYSPSAVGEDTGQLRIFSDDARTPEYVLELSANSSTPCLRLSESELEFSPAVAIGDVRQHVIEVESCGGVPLELGGIERISGDATEIFIDEPEALEGLVVAAGESAFFNVYYAPIDEGVDTAEFELSSNDPLNPQAALVVIGSGTANQCPTAVISGGVLGGPIQGQEVAAVPLETLIVDGTGSYDIESSISEYRWSVSTRPAGSTAALVDAGDGSARLFLDLAGDYEVCLQVVDAQSTLSCNTDCVSVTATPNKKVHVQLVWYTDSDPVIGDTSGTDLDLHFVRLPQGTWGDAGEAAGPGGWDVYFENKFPTWIVADGNDEHPTLDIDDRDGEGPENVNLDDPNPCSWYAVGVHYFDDYGFDTSYGTVRIYVEGKRRFEAVNLPFELGGVLYGAPVFLSTHKMSASSSSRACGYVVNPERTK